MTPELVPIFIELYFTKMIIIIISSVYHWRFFLVIIYYMIPHDSISRTEFSESILEAFLKHSHPPHPCVYKLVPAPSPKL